VLNSGLSLLIGHLHIFEWYVVRCGSKNIDSKGHVFERDWTTCSEYDSHSRLNSVGNWGDLYDHLMSTRIFTLKT